MWIEASKNDFINLDKVHRIEMNLDYILFIFSDKEEHCVSFATAQEAAREFEKIRYKMFESEQFPSRPIC